MVGAPLTSGACSVHEDNGESGFRRGELPTAGHDNRESGASNTHNVGHSAWSYILILPPR